MIKIALSRIAVFILSLSLASPSLFAYWVWSPESGKFINPEAAVQDTPQEQYDYAMEFYKKKDFKEAAEQLRLLLKKYPGSQIAAEAQYRLGGIYEEMGDYYKAFRSYRDLLQRYPQSERMSDAIEKEFRIGNLFLSGRKAKVLGLEILPSAPRAVEVFEHIVEAAPYSKYGDQAQFHLGLAHKKANQFEESIQAFQSVIDQYPHSELIPEAQFQIADTAYLQSVVATRDQRVMDRASKEIDRFLKRYPDSSTSDRAAKLRQEIDEKNAEKNYRIAFYYEKENFLDSAFIYYRDVSERYPDTQWGRKAGERLQALEKPAEYLKAQETEIVSRKAELAAQIQTLGKSDEARKKELEWEMKRLEKEGKQVEKAKPETLKRRKAAVREKERELNRKWKALAKKKKHFSKNTSEDLASAFERWEASLQKEKADLVREKLQIKEWGKGLGVSTAPFYNSLTPFGKEPLTPLEQVDQLTAGRLRELSEEEKNLIKEKENFYREYEKLLATEGPLGGEKTTAEDQAREWEALGREIEALEGKLAEKEELYKEHFGAPPWKTVLQLPQNVIGRSVDVLNPFDRTPQKDWTTKSSEELRSLEKQWQDAARAQEKLVESIGKTFDEELVRQEEKALVSKAEKSEMDASELRRTVKQAERDIRSHYNEIQDRNARKNELLEELEKRLRSKEEEERSGLARTERALTAPARGAYWFGKSFLFGLSERDVKLTEEAKQVSGEGPDSAEIRAIQEEIELESLLIDAKSREIERLQRQAEALKAQVSLSGTPPSRSLLVKFPYVFIREAIASARRLVPKRDRKEKLIGQLSRETEKLERLRTELKGIQTALQNKGEGIAPITSQVVEPAAIPDQEALREEIQSLQKEYELKKEEYESERENFEKKRWDKLSKWRAKMGRSKLEKIEEKIADVIEQEQKIRSEEATLLSKKKEMISEFLSQPPIDLFEKELHREQEEIDARLNEIQKRETSLVEELRRFRPQAQPPA
ncbi:MAG: outer membrane protein assembly factor BamD [Candidatus Omnitrophica bacterium]|nr:outer membrane protein assembly factor BamD [Candidatus Omnitrophota bacterium]